MRLHPFGWGRLVFWRARSGETGGLRTCIFAILHHLDKMMSVARAHSLKLPFLAMILAVPSAALAQRAGEVMVPGGVMPSGTLPAVLGPSDTLAQNLRILASNPRDVTALTQAGISALAVGDPNAALGFLARAEQLSPTNGRVKAALGSVMVMMERPNDALPFFRQALALGIPEAVFAGDRGLAFDLLGDPRAAQRDYAMALRQGRDAETVRRMALSLGITGNKDQALTMLDPLIRQQDQAAWRARAFVLAMTGDQRGADRIIQQVAPPEMVGTMSSFLRRLPSLPIAARASAVNFGTMPTSGPAYAAQASTSSMRAIPVSMTDTLTHQETVVASPVTASDENSRKSRRASRRRPDRDLVAATTARPVVAEPAPAFDDRTVRDDRRDRKPRTRDEKVAALNALYDQAQAKPTSAAPATAASPPVGRAASVVDPARTVAMAPSRTVAEPLPTRTEVPEPVFEISSAPVAIPAAPRPVVVASPSLSAAPPAATALTRPPATTATPVPAPVVARALPSPPVPVATTPSAPPVATGTAAPALVAAAAPPAAPAPKLEPVAQEIRPTVVAPPPPLPPVSSAPLAATTPVGDMVATSNPVPAPALVRPAPAFMGPPVPEGVSQAAPAAVVASAPPVPVAPVAIAEPIAVAPVEAITQPVPAAPDAAPAPVEEKGLESLLDDLTPEAERPAGAVLGDAEFRRARAAAKKRADADAKVKAAEEAEALAKKEEEDAKKRELAKHPVRYWVQVGTGNSKGGAAPTIRKVREQAGETLSRYGSATVPWKATQRLLVGPFGSEAEAKKAVNALAKKGVNATTFASSAGQEVSKLATK